MKLKREVQDMRAEAYFAPALNQYHDFAGQRLQYPHQHPALGVGYPSMYPSVGYPSMGPPIMGPSMGQQLQGPQPTVTYHMAPRFY